MKTSKFNQEQSAYALRQVEAGTSPADICRESGLRQATTGKLTAGAYLSRGTFESGGRMGPVRSDVSPDSLELVQRVAKSLNSTPRVYVITLPQQSIISSRYHRHSRDT
jgi:hypothetical protein